MFNSTVTQLLEDGELPDDPVAPGNQSAPKRRLRRITLTASIEALVTDAQFSALKDDMDQAAIDLTEGIQSPDVEVRATSVHEDR